MNVEILVTIPNKRADKLCTLVFDTLRVGFPTSGVTVWDNCNEEWGKVEGLAKRSECEYIHLHKRIHLAAWIKDRVTNSNGPIVFCDPDVAFWKSVEDFKFNTMLGGYFVPFMWNEFAHCISLPRLHTSLLFIRDCQLLLECVKKIYPYASSPTGEYSPLDAFSPHVSFYNGRPYFWDVGAELYSMLGGTRFTNEQKECFDHVNSASFSDVMTSRMANGGGFLAHQDMFSQDVKLLKGHYKTVDAYYERMNQKAKVWLI